MEQTRFTDDEFLEHFKGLVNKAGGVDKFAVENNVNSHNVEDILDGAIRCPISLVKKLGYDRQVMFIKIEG